MEREFEIEKWIEKFNSTVPLRYFKRNVPAYTLVTYINHSLILFKGNHFDSCYMFLKRAGEFLEDNKDLEINREYLEVVNQYSTEINSFLITNNLVDKELLHLYRIKK